MTTIIEALAIAVQRHQAGQLPEAEAIYRQILAVDANHPDTLALLGALSAQQGRQREGVDLLSRAIHLNPDVAAFHFNLGMAYRNLGLMAEATGSFRRAVQLKPDYFQAYCNLGEILWSLGHVDEAQQCFRAT